MRTTLSLDEDVVAPVDEEMRKSGRLFEETVNGLLRVGLRQGPAPRRFGVEPRELGLQEGNSYDDVQELLDQRYLSLSSLCIDPAKALISCGVHLGITTFEITR